MNFKTRTYHNLEAEAVGAGAQHPTVRLRLHVHFQEEVRNEDYANYSHQSCAPMTISKPKK